MDIDRLLSDVSAQWDGDIVPQLTEYIRVPAKSPHFDAAMGSERPHRARHPAGAGLGAARSRSRARAPRSCACRAARRCCSSTLRRATPGRSHGAAVRPPRQAAGDGRLARRARPVGAAASTTASSTAAAAPTTATRCSPRSSALGALQAEGVAHARCVGVIETCEESGSYDLPAYLELLAPRLGAVDLVVGLDSGCGDYERLWMTTSLRGLASAAR